MPPIDPRLVPLLRDGPVPAGSLAQRLAISRATLSRGVSKTRGVVRIGRTRATQYALAREVRTFGSDWPLYRIDSNGHAVHAGVLHALEPQAWWYEWAGARPQWLLGEFATGLFPDLPWFLDDLRPQGFLGRSFARRHHEFLGLAADPRLWDGAAVLVALLQFGNDLPGDFVLGDQALAQAQRAALRPPEPIPSTQRADRYSHLAAAALSGETSASSVAGEQPKFTARIDDGGEVRHVLVKFSPTREVPSGRRWADLLVCEHLAAEVLRARGIAACDTRIVDGRDRRYLEVTRFDRVGDSGRRGFNSLSALDAAYFGKLDTWIAAADRLERNGWLDSAEAQRLRVLWCFGGLIGNTDMHFGNISLSLDGLPCRLAPTYDMLPMCYRPDAHGEVVERTFEPPLPTPIQLPAWRQAATLAAEFWTRASRDERVSEWMRVEAGRNRDVVHRLQDRFG